eukprot:TRINITY_DN3711_c0_g1_i1.p1 TRINITY_DN3711_c0_g1~~TRINITY_DN3711_c0_g1_i1.p1  ORF type:complete len:292 (-),score=71.69 TRINITY_DN3711_c0_g1_i1:40-888(-)
MADKANKNDDAMNVEEVESDSEVNIDDVELKPHLYDDEFVLEDGVEPAKIKQMIDEVRSEITKLESEVDVKVAPLINGEEYEVETFAIPPYCIPIRCDVRYLDWDALAGEVGNFDVITMDPPWQLAGAAPTRGVAIGYKQLGNKAIEEIPIPKLQKKGFLFIWVINARYSFAVEMMERWGYKVIDDISWVKSTVNRRLAKGHGFYLQHAKETCIVGKKGDDLPDLVTRRSSDVIFSERRGQSQKPEEIYELIEKMVPGGKYMEIFARRNNLRNYWVSVGLEL